MTNSNKSLKAVLAAALICLPVAAAVSLAHVQQKKEILLACFASNERIAETISKSDTSTIVNLTQCN